MKQFKIPNVTLTGGAGATKVASVPIPTGELIRVVAEVRTKDATTGDNSFIVGTAVVKNLAGTTTIVGSASIDATFSEGAAALTMVANDTDNTLDIKVTPSANDTIAEGINTVERFSETPV